MENKNQGLTSNDPPQLQEPAHSENHRQEKSHTPDQEGCPIDFSQQKKQNRGSRQKSIKNESAYQGKENSKIEQVQRSPSNHFVRKMPQQHINNDFLMDFHSKPRPESSISRQCWTEINQLKAMKAKWETQKQLLIEEDLLNQKKNQQFKERRQLKDISYDHHGYRYQNKEEDRSSVSSSKNHKIRRIKKKQNKGFESFMVAPHQLSKKSNYGSNSRYEQTQKEHSIQSSSIQPHDSRNFNTKYATIEYSRRSRQVGIYRNQGNLTSRSRSKTNSFVLTTTKNKREILKQNQLHREEEENKSRNQQAIMQQEQARAHIDMLNLKVREMQEKLASIETKQKQLQEEERQIQRKMEEKRKEQEKKKKQSELQKLQELKEKISESAHESSSKSGSHLKNQPVKGIKFKEKQLSRKSLKSRQSTQNANNKSLQKPMPKNLPPEIKLRPPSQQSHTQSIQSGRRGLKFKKIKLDISSSIINYNLSQQPEIIEETLEEKIEKQKQERTILKQKMEHEIGGLKKIIRDLKLQRIKREAIISELEDKKRKEENFDQPEKQKTCLLDQSQTSGQIYHQQLAFGDRESETPKQNIVVNMSRLQSQVSDGNRQAGAIIRTSNNGFKKHSQAEYQQPNNVNEIEGEQEKALPKKKTLASELSTPIRKISQKIPNAASNKQILKEATFRESAAMNPEDKSTPDSDAKTISRISATLPTRKGIIIRQIEGRKNMSRKSTEKVKEFTEIDESVINSRISIHRFSTKNSQINNKRLEFVPIEEYKRNQIQSITPPQISIPNINIPPQFPIPTQILRPILLSWTPKQLLEAAKSVFEEFGIKVKSASGNLASEISMKKYKNCIIFTIPNEDKTIVWHYSGKFYIGGWVPENTIQKEEEDQKNEIDEFGETKNLKHGSGFEYLPGRYCYKGQFYGGKKQGKGTLLLDEGDIYEGEWKKGDKCGQGVYYEKKSGMLYEGEWNANKKQGKGTLKFTDRQFYIGQFYKNIKHGKGLQLFNNGDIYEGEYAHGFFNGEGRYFWVAGASYEGNFKNGRRDGFGKWRASIKDGDYYEGEYKQDKKHGQGLYIWENGSQYHGEFKNDFKHGKGAVEYIDGRKIEGSWEYGKLAGIYQNRTIDIVPIPQPQEEQDQGSLTSSIRQHIGQLKETPYRATQLSANLVQS